MKYKTNTVSIPIKPDSKAISLLRTLNDHYGRATTFQQDMTQFKSDLSKLISVARDRINKMNKAEYIDVPVIGTDGQTTPRRSKIGPLVMRRDEDPIVVRDGGQIA